MRLKDLVMQVDYENLEPAIAAAFAFYHLECNKKTNWRKVFDTLRSMEPAQKDMTLRVVPGDVSGYYDEKTLAEHPDYQDVLYSLTTTPWCEWLGMEVDADTLKNMSAEDILGNCIYEMTWWGYDEETIKRNYEEELGRMGENEKSATEDEDKDEEGEDGTVTEIDAKTKCKNLLKSFIPVILPTIAERCGEPEFEKNLQEVNCAENGAYCEPIDIKAFGLPLTGIAFYYIYIDGACMFGVSTEIEGETAEIVYGWFAPSMKELKDILESENCQNEIIDTLTKQIDEKVK